MESPFSRQRAANSPVTRPPAASVGPSVPSEPTEKIRVFGRPSIPAAAGIDGLPNTLIFSVGSDGTDGPTDAAGGLVTGEFAARCREKGLSIEKTLADNDAYNLLRQTDGLIVTGPTGTNVCDLTMLLVK